MNTPKEVGQRFFTHSEYLKHSFTFLSHVGSDALCFCVRKCDWDEWQEENTIERGTHTHMQFSGINSEMCMLLIYSGLFSLIEIQTSDTDLMEPFEIDLKSKIIEFMVSIIWNIPSDEYMTEWKWEKKRKPFLFTFDPKNQHNKLDWIVDVH